MSDDDQYQLELDDAPLEDPAPLYGPLPRPRQVVQRFELYPSPGTTVLKLPRPAKFLHAGFGKAGISVVHLWFLVDPADEKVERGFRAFGTGDAISYEYEYVGTAQDASMSKAWHIFEDARAAHEELSRLFTTLASGRNSIVLPNDHVAYERDPDVPSYPRLDSTPDRSAEK